VIASSPDEWNAANLYNNNAIATLYTSITTLHVSANNTVKCTAQNRSVTRNDHQVLVVRRDRFALRASLVMWRDCET